MKLLLPILAFSGLFGLPTLALSAQEKWEGYRNAEEIRSLNLPFQEFAENAVFNIESVSNTEIPGEKIEILDMQKDPRVKTRVTDKKTLTYDYFHFQTETCRKQNLRYCPIFKVTTAGTMFKNGNKLYTCRHAFHNWLALAAEANGRSVDTISPPIILRTPNPKKPRKFIVVYQSAFQGEPLLQFTMINNDPRLNYQFHKDDYPTVQHRNLIDQIEFTEMTISDSQYLGTYSLPVRDNAWSSIQNNEEVYLAGYPLPTNAFGGSQGDSPGFTLLFSNGFILKKVASEVAISTSSFATPGTSGGAVFSAQGELLGINCSGFDKNIPKNVTSYFIPLDKEAVIEGWNQIDYTALGSKQAQVDSTN
jgi:hypothetical protein